MLSQNVPLADRLAYTIPVACALGGFGKTTAYRLIETGELKSVKRAGRRLILRADLEAFLARDDSDARL